LLLTMTIQLSAQTGMNVTGKIVDAQTKAPIAGVSVVQSGSTSGTITKEDGTFQLQAPANATLLISYVGYTGQQVKVTGGSLTIALVAEDNLIDDV